jgi:hypothetical protein
MVQEEIEAREELTEKLISGPVTVSSTPTNAISASAMANNAPGYRSQLLDPGYRDALSAIVLQRAERRSLELASAEPRHPRTDPAPDTRRDRPIRPRDPIDNLGRTGKADRHFFPEAFSNAGIRFPNASLTALDANTLISVACPAPKTDGAMAGALGPMPDN